MMHKHRVCNQNPKQQHSELELHPCSPTTCSFPILTILLLLRQDGDLFTFGKIKEEEHCLFSNDICKVYVVYLEKWNGGR